MIEAKDILSMNFYSYGKPFTGSCTGMRYRIIMLKKETGKDSEDKPLYEKYFEVSTWPEPYGYEATDQEKITVKEFPFSEAGYESVVEYLNAYEEKYRV